jgi:DNA-binding PadR family transcriptional regulator
MEMATGSATLTRLVVLWLLSEGPLHGYRIKKILDDEGLSFWFPIEYASIYTVLRTLVKTDHVRIVAVERDGQRPERTRYSITRSGRRHLNALLERAWREPPRPADPIQLALAARSELGEERVAALILERAEALRQRLILLERLGRSAPAPEMVGRQAALTRAELEWLESLTAEGGTHDDS